jgi:type III secretion system FlhB-like substrate exporter
MAKKNTENPQKVIKEITQKLKMDNFNNLSDILQLTSQGKSILKKHYSLDDKSIIDFQYESALLLNRVGGYQKEVEKLIKNSISKYIKLYGPKHPGLSKFYYVWASALNDSEKYEKANLMIEQAKYLGNGCRDKKLVNDINTEYYIQKLSVIGSLKKIEDAKIIYETGLKNINKDTVDMGFLYFEYGLALHIAEKYEEANKLFRQSYQILKKQLGMHHISIFKLHICIADSYYNLADYDRAIKILQKRLIDYINFFGNDHIESIDIKSRIGSTLFRMEKYDEASIIFKETAIAMEKEYGSDNESSAGEYNKLAFTFEKAGNNREATKYYLKAIHGFEKNDKIDISTKYNICSWFIEYLWKNKHYKKASQYMELCVLVADVIITKEDKIAVALYYDDKTMDTPTITILGKNTLARSIIRMAQDKNIPIVDNANLATEMINEFKPGNAITEQYYQNVATIFSHIFVRNKYSVGKNVN